MNRIYSCIIFIIISLPLIGQRSHADSGGASTMSLGYMINNLDGVQSMYGNVASLSDLKSWGVNVGYARRYNLAELATVSAAAGVKTKLGNFGIVFNQYGFEEYSESKIGLGYSRNLFSNLSIGAMFDMLTYDANVYGMSRIFTFELGAKADVNDKLSISAHLFNPLEAKINNTNTVPGRLSVGVSYAASEKAEIYGEVMKISDRNPEVKLAFNYNIVEQLALRVGANVTNSAIFFGVNFGFGDKANVIGAYSYDNRLGSTPALSVSYGE